VSVTTFNVEWTPEDDFAVVLENVHAMEFVFAMKAFLETFVSVDQRKNVDSHQMRSCAVVEAHVAVEHACAMMVTVDSSVTCVQMLIFVGLSNAFVTVGALLVYFLLPIAKWYLRLLMNAPANVANST
jgi:hypothetical protein